MDVENLHLHSCCGQRIDVDRQGDARWRQHSLMLCAQICIKICAYIYIYIHIHAYGNIHYIHHIPIFICIYLCVGELKPNSQTKKNMLLRVAASQRWRPGSVVPRLVDEVVQGGVAVGWDPWRKVVESLKVDILQLWPFTSYNWL